MYARTLFRICTLAVVVGLLGLAPRPGRAAEPANVALKLPAVLGENMVVQRDKPVPVWGWAAPGDTVTVRFADQTKTATADATGRWEVRLVPMKASKEPRTLVVSSQADKTELKLANVLVGEVWLCSGQSNMQMSVGGVRNAWAEIERAKLPEIRLFTVSLRTAVAPQSDCQGHWAACSPSTVGAFSAVGFFFGRKLHEELDVPIGLIGSSWGGTIAEAWTSAPTLRAKLPEFTPALDELAKGEQSAQKAAQNYKKQMAVFGKDCQRLYQIEEDLKSAAKFAAPAFDDSGWKTMTAPANWEAAGLPGVDGIVWFRKTIDVPAAWAGKDLVLRPGPIDEVDVTWFNGVEVGARGRSRTREVRFWNVPRAYKVPGKLVKAGPNVIAIRVSDMAGQGGLWGGAAKTMFAELTDGTDKTHISLAGDWRYFAEFVLPPRPRNPVTPNRPSVLYNAMIAPLVPFALRGAIWYQGESNAGRAMQYRKLLPALIQDWRRAWQTQDFPFLIVQLANFLAPTDQPSQNGWAGLREAQLMTLSVPQTGLAVIIDIGEAKDIHPKNKQDVGLRLALWALAKTYGKKGLVYSGPLYKSMGIEGGQIRLRFDHIGGGLVAKGGGPLKRFAIAGKDHKFVWADAKIDGDTVVVSSPKVKAPAAVRYAWANNPEGCNLYNRAGLPASPFRTDDWEQ